MPFRRGLLGYFVVVAQEGQITRAAAKLHMTQPSLSQAITQLEDELGLQLFERHARGVSLTSAGERFYAKAALAVTATAEVQEAANALVRAELGTIALGFVGAPPGLDSPRALEAFSRAHPRIDIRYRELPFPSPPPPHGWLRWTSPSATRRPPTRGCGPSPCAANHGSYSLPGDTRSPTPASSTWPTWSIRRSSA